MKGILLAAALAAAAWGADPNLSGAWKLNNDKSEFGRLPQRPGPTVTTIRQDGNTLHASSKNSTGVVEYEWTLDGKECTNVVHGNEVKSTATWRGPILQVKSKLQAQGQTLSIVDQYSLSEDGKTMTTFRTIQGPAGETEQRYVYDKVPSSN